MYCPKCGSQNIENAQFCRACGTNLSSVSQALEGKLPEAVPTTLDHDLNRRRIEHAVKNILMGVVFLVIAAYFWNKWGIWMLIPAAGLLSQGIGKMISLKYVHGSTPSLPKQREMEQPQRSNQLLQDNPPVTMPPPSITEGTTRNLDPIRRDREKN